jgi:hypothetical protein
MQPTLQPGQGLIATQIGRPKQGQLRCFEHPQRPGFWLVKRVASVHVDGTMTVSADNPAGSDSRTFGDVACAGSYRVLIVVPLRFM